MPPGSAHSSNAQGASAERLRLEARRLRKVGLRRSGSGAQLYSQKSHVEGVGRGPGLGSHSRDRQRRALNAAVALNIGGRHEPALFGVFDVDAQCYADYRRKAQDSPHDDALCEEFIEGRTILMRRAR